MILDRRVSVLFILVFILILVLIVESTPRTEAIYQTNIKLYPNLINILDEISTIELSDKEKTLQLNKNNEGTWQIANNSNFPAQLNLVNDFLLGLAYLKVVDQKTKDPQLFSLLHVDDINNKNSQAIAIKLRGQDNKVLINLLVGKQNKQNIIVSKQQQIYVRKKDEQQSWLVEGYLPISLAFQDWVSQPLLPINTTDIRKIVVINNVNKAPIVFLKKNDNTDFLVSYAQEQSNNNKNVKKQNYAAIRQHNALVHILSNLQYNNASLYKGVVRNWHPSLKIDVETIHNFKFHIELAKIRKQTYAKVIAKLLADNHKDTAIQHINNFNKINEYSKLWVFQLSDELYNLLNTSHRKVIERLKQ